MAVEFIYQGLFFDGQADVGDEDLPGLQFSDFLVRL